MARILIENCGIQDVHLLDPGAGAGSLTESVLEVTQRPIRATLVEKDPVLADHLVDLVDEHNSSFANGSEVIRGDFLRVAQRLKIAGTTFSHVIMNPPYQRIMIGDEARKALTVAGLQVPNLYAAFLWWGVQLLEPEGRLVAVVPRSFLSGRQFRRLRAQILSECGLVRLHHFRNRKSIFGRDSVQQEVVVICLVKGAQLPSIDFSSSDGLHDISQPAASVPANRLIARGSDDDVVLVPASTDAAKTALKTGALPILDGLEVSVGSIVDFRHLADLCDISDDAVPLVGSEIFASRPKARRGIKVRDETLRHIKPPGEYVVIRRISPPESRPRLQAVHLHAMGGDYVRGVAFENHVLFVHSEGRGLQTGTCQSIMHSFESSSAQSQIAERCSSTQINTSDVLAIRGPER